MDMQCYQHLTVPDQLLILVIHQSLCLLLTYSVLQGKV